MLESVYLLTLCLLLGTVLLVFGMRYTSVVLQARARAAADGAGLHGAAQAEVASALKEIAGALSDVQSRLAGIEKILKQVE